MKIEVEDDGIVLSECYSGIGIKTDKALFGVAQRDGGIEVLRDGVIVWASEHDPAVYEQTHAALTRLLEQAESISLSGDNNGEQCRKFLDAIYAARRALGKPER
jgi:hypothetical protein